MQCVRVCVCKGANWHNLFPVALLEACWLQRSGSLSLSQVPFPRGPRPLACLVTSLRKPGWGPHRHPGISPHQWKSRLPLSAAQRLKEGEETLGRKRKYILSCVLLTVEMASPMTLRPVALRARFPLCVSVAEADRSG